jgi:hypothetical protein
VLQVNSLCCSKESPDTTANMVLIVPPPPTLSPSSISAFYVIDELLARSPILIYYGPSATPTSATPSSNNSRIQAHVYSPAGLQSYARLTVSPSSPLYAAVNCLPREEQGDDICRGLAFSLCKYFAELPPGVKATWEAHDFTSLGRGKAAPKLFSEAHAALLASKMVKVENIADVIKDVSGALAEQSVSWMDVDVILPAGAIKKLDERDRGSAGSELEEGRLTSAKYGTLASMVRLFGEQAFLPTTRLRRAPSRPTGMNRTAIFQRKQKENIRREMCELLDTEENYVAKLNELVNVVAAEFREKAMSKDTTSMSPSAETVAALFPESLDQILETNETFLDTMRKVVEDTENEAIHDIESTTDDPNINVFQPGDKATDMTGTVALADCLHTWFPKFADSYVHYTKAHSGFSQLVRNLTKESSSSFSKRVNETGEQRLMSMLIEPVQRLPRYNLYIDNIIKQLPAKHPALKPLLKARDTISEICSRDSMVSPSRALDALRRLVPSWPQSFRPNGRLVSAIDAAELSPPYRKDLNGPKVMFSILLVFTDYIVVLKKPNKTSISARGVMAQVDGQDLFGSDSKPEDYLTFRQALELGSFEITEMDHGRLIQIVPAHGNKAITSRPSSRPGSLSSENLSQVFQLMGQHENKASRVVEDITKARVEGRYAESERETGKWEVRAAQGVDLTLFAAFSEEYDAGNVPVGRGLPSKLRITIDSAKCKFPAITGDVDLHANLMELDDGFFRLDIVGNLGEGAGEFSYRDEVTEGEFLPVLTKRIGNFFQLKSQIKNPSVTRWLILTNQHIMQSLKIVTSDMMSTVSDGASFIHKPSLSRPHSPVKLLSNLFGSSKDKEHGLKRPAVHHSQSSLGSVPVLTPQTSLTQDSTPARQEGQHLFTNMASQGLERLEETLSAYILALEARKGNIVGRSLRSRHQTADSTAVNDLYNALLESPIQTLNASGASGATTAQQLAAQAPVDVLFMAFEQFIHMGWSHRMGPVIAPATWIAIQSSLECCTHPAEFQDTFRARFADMSPQNRRATKAIVKLLADLLSGTGNDGDRGILTASFAEVLVPRLNIEESSLEMGELDPMGWVGVLDSLIEDGDILMSDGRGVTPTLQHSNSITSESRFMSTTKSSSGGSSSLRKKFGLLTRKSSKSQHSTLTPGISIQHSNSHSHSQSSSSLSKATALLGRSHSDAQTYFTSTQFQQPSSNAHESTNYPVLSPSGFRRPGSRDRPTVLGAFGWDSIGPPPGSSGSTSSHHSNHSATARPLSTIGEGALTSSNTSSLKGQPKKKKRRSSLSDLAALRESIGAGANSPSVIGTGLITPRKPVNHGSPAGQTLYLGRSPSPSVQTPSPTKRGSMIPQLSSTSALNPAGGATIGLSRPGSSGRRENASPVRPGLTGMTQPRMSPTKISSAPSSGSNSRPGTSGSSGIPTSSANTSFNGSFNTSGSVIITAHPPATSASPKRRNTGSVTVTNTRTSGIPQLKSTSSAPPVTTGLSDRATNTNARKLPPTPNTKAFTPSPNTALSPANTTASNMSNSDVRPQPLNLPGSKSRIAGLGTSPVKARISQIEKKEEEQKALIEELKVVGEELAGIKSRSNVQGGLGSPEKRSGTTRMYGHSRTKSAASGVAIVANSGAHVSELEARLEKLSAKQAALLYAASAPVVKDPSIDTTQVASLRLQVTNLEAVNRDLDIELETLYSHFNSELSRVLSSIQAAGKNDDEWKKRVDEVEKDNARLRRENGILKKEIAMESAIRDV